MAVTRKNVWEELDNAKQNLLKRAQEYKQAFIEMPGGMPPAGDPAAMGGMPPGGDPAATGGMPPEMAGAMPPGGDPAAMGGMPMDPAMMSAMGGAPMGVDPAMAGTMDGMPPADPAAAGAAGAIAGGAAAGTPEPTLTLTLSQLWDVVTKVLGLAKKIGANGQGIATEGSPAPATGGVSQDAIKAAVIEALGNMGAMKMAAASDASRAAAIADLRAAAGEERAQAKASKLGTTVHFGPKFQKAINEFAARYGQPTNEEINHVLGIGKMAAYLPNGETPLAYVDEQREYAQDKGLSPAPRGRAWYNWRKWFDKPYTSSEIEDNRRRQAKRYGDQFFGAPQKESPQAARKQFEEIMRAAGAANAAEWRKTGRISRSHVLPDSLERIVPAGRRQQVLDMMNSMVMNDHNNDAQQA